MTAQRSKIIVLDDHPWRRHAFAASLATLKMDCATNNLRGTEPMSVSASQDTSLHVAVLGGDCLGSPAGEAAVMTLMQRLDPASVVVVSEEITSHCIATALRLGLRGVFSSRMQLDILEATLNFVLAGGTYIPHAEIRNAEAPTGYLPPPARPVPEASAQMDVPVPAPMSLEPMPDLTRRQRDVAVALAEGASNKVIARELNVSEATVKTHVRQLMRKLDASNRTQAALKAQALTQHRGSDAHS